MIAAAILLPAVAILHATETSTNTSATSHDSDQNDQNQHHQDTEHDDNETSDDNSITHADVDDANDATETD